MIIPGGQNGVQVPDLRGILALLPTRTWQTRHQGIALYRDSIGFGTAGGGRGDAESMAGPCCRDIRLCLRLGQPYADRTQSPGDVHVSAVVAGQRFPYVLPVRDGPPGCGTAPPRPSSFSGPSFSGPPFLRPPSKAEPA